MITKSFRLSEKEFNKLLKFVTESSGYEKHIILNIYGRRVMVFHNDTFLSKDHCNSTKILLFKKLYDAGKVDSFCCCYPEETCLPMELCFMGRNARGEIHHSGDSNKVIFTCAGKRSH